jgi:hypothetical protein
MGGYMEVGKGKGFSSGGLAEKKRTAKAKEQKLMNYFLKQKDLILNSIFLTKHFNLNFIMARLRKRTCNVTGITTSESNFYKGHTHVKAVDNLRRTTGANKNQLKRMFNTLTTY